MKVLAITPCRRDSRRVKGKNLRELCHRPLVWYTINAVKQSRTAIRHIISTNDARLKDYAEKYTEVLLHPDELSEDGKSSFGVVRYVVQLLLSKDDVPDIVLLLRATSPLRTAEDIDEALSLFVPKEQEGYSSVIGYTELESPHPKRMRGFDGYRLINIYWEKEHALRQELRPKLLLRNEAIYVIRPQLIVQGTLWGEKPFPHIMPAERSVNINNELDFLVAEAILKHTLATQEKHNISSYVYQELCW